MGQKISTATALALLLALPALPALTQETESTSSDEGVKTLETITVTSFKREQSLLELPNAVTAVGAQTVENLRLSDARDLIQLVPSAFLQENNAGTARDISIRGVATPTLFAEPGVSLYIDEIYASGFISYPTQFRDIERVEVLRGPQGALYGRNAVGGAVNVISARPDDEFSGRVRATAASFDRYEVEGILNVPVSDKLAIRALSWYDDQAEGEYFNQTLDQYIDSSRSTGGRLSALFTPTDAFSVTATVETEDADGPGTYLFFPESGETEKTIQRDTQPTNAWEATRYSLKADYVTGAGTFTFVAGGRTYELSGVEDTDLSASTTVDLLTGQLGQQITTRSNTVDSTFAEARWLSPDTGPLSILAGVNYLDEEAEGDILTNLQGLSFAFAGGLAPFTLGIENNQRLTSYAVFGEANWALNDQTNLIVSGRYTNDDKSVDFVFTPTPTLFGFVGGPQTAQVSDTFDNFSPGVTVAYAASDTLNTYAKVQTGFRAGGYNFNVANAANLRYEEETSINYEVGAKKSLADGKGYVAVSAYLLQQEDVLVPVFDVTAPPGLQGYLINAGEAETLGIELEGSFEIFEGLTLQGSAGFLNAEFTSGSFANALAQVVNLDGLQVPSSRDWTGSFLATYRRPFSATLDIVANASFTTRSDGFQDTENAFEISGNEQVNLSAGIETERFQVLGFVQNATDDKYEIAFGGFRPPSAVGVTRARGTVVGVTLSAGF